MTKPAREHLLGYVLGTLDPNEVESIEHQLATDPAFQCEVDAMEQRVAPLHATRFSYDPPTSLAQRTCEFIFEQRSATATLDSPMRAANPTPPNKSRGKFREGSRFTQTETSGTKRAWSLADMGAIGGVIAILGCILLPVISQSRQQHLRTVCENNLQKIGTGFIRFVDINNGSYPKISTDGALSVAGAFPVQLISDNCLTEEACLICPSSPLASSRAEWSVPTVTELEFANSETLLAYYETMGGSYAYNFGYLVDGELVTPKFEGRPLYPVASDAPSGNLPNMSSPFHCGYGQNILFEDNSVRYVVNCQLVECGNDDIFFNRDGKVAAGLDINDAVLGSSCDSPIMKVSLER
ncbi:MAG: hypothetical protein ACI9HK_001425 [Pirellulaceae bacterium]|jgi:hypothetical protein